MILIVSDDKAMLHNWPKGGEEYFFELQGSYQDFNSKFDFNGKLNCTGPGITGPFTFERPYILPFSFE